jgi:hypothetical protein
MDEYSSRRTCKNGLQVKGARPINPPEMNETVYLFALSVPALIEQIIDGRTGPRTPVVVPPRTEERS